MMLTPRERQEIAIDVATLVVEMLEAKGSKPHLLDARGLADAMGVSMSTIDRWTSQRKIPVALREGAIRRYCLADVLGAFRANEAVA